MAPQKLDKILCNESYAKVAKRNRDDNELDTLKIMPFKGVKKRKEIFFHWASCIRGSFTPRKKTMAELHTRQIQNPTLKPTKGLSLDHRRKEGLPSLIQGT